MRREIRNHLLAAAVVAAGFVPRADAQNPPPCTLGGSSYIGYGLGEKNNSAFTGVTKYSFEQRLADGNVIRTVAYTHQARDSAGRTRMEMPSGCQRGEDGQLHTFVNVNVSDPAANITMNWQTNPAGPKTVRIMHREPVAPHAVVRKTLTPEEQAAMLQRQKLQASMAPPPNRPKMERLGTQTFHGVSAEGTRTTRTIPAGEEGNDLPLVTVEEVWRSNSLGITVMATTDDPRRGKSTFEYEEFNPGEPEPGMFVPPADYKVEDVHPNNDAR